MFGPFDIDFDGTCNFRSWKEQVALNIECSSFFFHVFTQADAAADAANLELSYFQHRILVLPYFSELYSVSMTGVK